MLHWLMSVIAKRKKKQLDTTLHNLDRAKVAVPAGSQEHLAFAVTQANLLQAKVTLFLKRG